ncbi:sigma-54-dependent Fis family transcriptional regulator [Ammoniphilus sp. YIM 78166]|uniref:sigma-54 interaction domain-containing protein n=1 Tax=Ammoniphilus sp. YIM 78166 TaxID=1644106 RepID=UPI00106F8C69|nr:sigma 54-interacting transcriptional regulator [Ammoniphilus sp. YIM 78166]
MTIIKDLEFIFDQHPSPLITLNDKGRVVRINPATKFALGWSEEDVLGQAITGLMTKLDQQEKYACKNVVFSTRHLDGSSIAILQGETQKTKDTLTNQYHFSDIIQDDPHMRETIAIAQKVARIDISLLINGESGTGKELFAQSIHGASPRADKSFIALNCSAIPESLLESELFGYEKGAFTGAKSNGQAGKFEAANGGTLFLDEIGDMPLTAQATLLRVLQERCVTRIGGISPRPIDVRIIAATHKDLQKEIEAGRFRADLYFRLNGFNLKLPALRDRQDLILLAEHVLSKLPFLREKAVLQDDAQQFILSHTWSGNFRELQNVLQQAALLADGQPITRSLLQSICCPQVESVAIEPVTSIKEHELQLIEQVLKQTNGNISRAAKMLNIGRNTLYRKLNAISTFA